MISGGAPGAGGVANKGRHRARHREHSAAQPQPNEMPRTFLTAEHAEYAESEKQEKQIPLSFFPRGPRILRLNGSKWIVAACVHFQG